MATIDDAAARERALDPTASFAVRAPAGSGKTTLLTQRVLCLLPRVEQPEQIVAITFTRKAAEEMRTRIMSALAGGRAEAPADAHAHTTWTLARAACAHVDAKDWQLDAQPGRLRILTIDALCQTLVRQMPLSAGLPGLPAVEEDARLLHRDAARAAIGRLADGGEAARHVTEVLRYLDNDWHRLESLLADMLGRRDQWLRFAVGRSERARLEAAFAAVVEWEIGNLEALIPEGLLPAIERLVGYAAEQLGAGGAGPGPSEHGHPLAFWQRVCAFALTAQGAWRARIDKRQGFPAQGETAKAMKALWADVVDELQQLSGVRRVLARIAVLPASPYTDDEWRMLDALFQLLRLATAHFIVSSESSGRTDFTAYSMAALQALGDPDTPSDLTLALDYRIQHLLIDEFQDTSVTQLELVKRLTAGWMPGDGRSLFVVGDPMQSIYRFRQADVSQFERMLRSGYIGSIPLEVLTLTTNFRAQGALVDWINDMTPRALASIEVPSGQFVAQHAAREAENEACAIHAFDAADAAREAEAVVAAVARLRACDATASIAILVRSRSHLARISPALVDAGMPVEVREVVALAELPAVNDLFALARALLHDADRIAWLAVLRAPWCGLTLRSLTALGAIEGTLGVVVESPASAEVLVGGERARLERVAVVMRNARRWLAEQPFAEALERTWITLGGPAVCNADTDLEPVRTFFEMLVELETESTVLSVDRLAVRLRETFVRPPAAPPGEHAVQVMTVHRAKGLEFDHVLIPGLGRVPKREAHRLLEWIEQRDLDDRPRLVVAAMPSGASVPTYDYLRQRQAAEADAERVRLLYVATTRARRQVHLFGHAALDAGGERRPARGSFLELLWGSVGDSFSALPAAPLPAEHAAPGGAEPPAIRRAAPKDLPAPVASARSSGQPSDDVEFDWAGITARHIGTVTHRLLQDWSRRAWSERTTWLENAEPFARARLLALGVDAGVLAAAVEAVLAALRNTFESARGRWLFDRGHTDVQAELCLASQADGVVHRHVIDRSFVDSEGRRWIVDFKTGQHAGGGLDAWLDSEQQRYAPQLEAYAATYAALDRRPIRLGLYFPLVDAWREWAYNAG